MAGHFSLRWNNFHRNMSSGFRTLLMEEVLVDVTLAADGRSVQAHRLVLSACSPYFKNLFSTTPCSHPIVIMKDVNFKQLTDVISFMYQGEVNVRQEELADFLKTAELLQIRGLFEENDENESPSTPQVSPQSAFSQPTRFDSLNGSCVNSQQKSQIKTNNTVKISSDLKLTLQEGNGINKDSTDVASCCKIQKLCPKNHTAPVSGKRMQVMEGPSNFIFTGVPVIKEETSDDINGTELNSCEHLPDNNLIDASVLDTTSELQDITSEGLQVATSEGLQVAERRNFQIINSPCSQGSTNSQAENLEKCNEQRKTCTKQRSKITRQRKQGMLALLKIRRSLIAPKRSRRIAFARKMKGLL